MHFDVEEIMHDVRNRTLAYKYNNYENVEVIHIEKTDNGFHISAIVSVFSQTSQCSINIENEQMTFHCDCDYCDEDEPCAHIGAVMCKINELNVTKFPFTYTKEEEERKYEEERKRHEIERLTFYSREVISQSKSRYFNEIQLMSSDEHYRIVPYVDTFFSTLQIKFKVGDKHLYLIKDIPQFLSHIENRAEVKYGKNLTFVHDESVFDEFALKQIQFMRHALSTRDNSYYYDNKMLKISHSNIDEFFEVYSESDELAHVVFRDSTQLFTIQIHDKGSYYEFHFEIDEKGSLMSGYKNIYGVKITGSSGNVLITRYQLDEKGRTRALLEDISHDSLFVKKEDFDDFYKYVLAPVQQYVNIEGDIDLESNEYVNTKLYGDVLDDSTVYFKLFYEDSQFNRVPGFNEQFHTTYEQDFVEQSLMTYCDHMDKEKNEVYFDINNEKTYQFIHEGLEKLKEYCEVYVSEALKRIGHATKYTITVGVRISNDLLALDFSSVEIPKMEIAQVLAQYRKKKKFYRLKNNELLYLDSPELEELSQMLDQYHMEPKDIEKGVLKLDKNRAFSIENNAQQFQNIQFERSQTFSQLINQFSAQQTPLKLSPYYQDLLRDYQKEGIQWLATLHHYGFNGILADDMGLGKTLQVIALLDTLKLRKPSLVVCPASLIYNWEDEVHKFSPNMSVQCIVGKASQRKELIAHMNDYRINITSYDYLRSDYELYGKTLGYLILDESQYIKNQKTKSAIAVKQLKAQHKIALSGTPIENSLAELWSVFDFLMPNYLFNYHYFKTHYETNIVKNHDQETIQQLQKLVSPFILRRNKKDVLTELPDKIETTQVVPFSDKESELYFANLAQVNEELQALFQVEHVDKMKILAMLTRLRQICCEPRMLYDNIDEISSKMKACLELICDYQKNNQKVLLFSTFTSVFDLLEQELKYNGISYLILTGSTPKELRQEYVKQFQEGKVDVFLISLRAGGTGLNLTNAQAVIHYDPWWNISAQNQATDRAYRIGQHHNVVVHKLIMKDSVEEKILKLQEKKKELSDLFVETSEGNIASLSQEDILELFR